MANQALLQTEEESKSGVPTHEGHELDAFLGKAFEEKNAFQGLYESIRDIFFPVKLPPLELTSQPIPVPDKMAVKRNPWATGISTTLNLGILAILLFVVGKKVIESPKPEVTTPVDISDFKLQGPQKASVAGGGGGGGSKDPVPPVKGRLPKLEPKPITPPQVAVLDKPKLAVEPSIDVQKDLKLPDNMNMPTIGVTNSPNVKLASNGPGSGAGMGSGSGGGLGSGSGNGLGPGSGGNTGGGLYRVGGGISAPSVLYAPEAEFSDEARRAKYQGVCLIAVIVDAHGNPVNPRVIRPLGMGLDEKALEAVRKYKFKPAMKDGRTPVPVMINIEVNFRLY
ncbi:MAG: TonB family protein [Acidobacteriota bacterium]|nr:TonB family protein [Acidobacteriota bacterium]